MIATLEFDKLDEIVFKMDGFKSDLTRPVHFKRGNGMPFTELILTYTYHVRAQCPRITFFVFSPRGAFGFSECFWCWP